MLRTRLNLREFMCFIFVLICLIFYDYHDPYNYLTADDYYNIYNFLVNVNIDVMYWL